MRKVGSARGKEKVDTYTGQHELLVLLDRGAAWNGGKARLVHWAEMNVPPGRDSIPQLVEQQSRSLRAEYLAWVHDLGEYRRRGRTLRELLRLNGDFSWWWLTLLAQKSPLKSPAIYEVFKLRALERLYLASGCRGLVLCSPERRLHRVLSDWCGRLGHPYRWQRQVGSARPRGWRERLRFLPAPLRALGALGHRLWARQRHFPPVPAVPGGGRQGTVVTYFPNIEPQEARQGIFRSRYWGELHDLLERGPWRINWIWLAEASEECSLAAARRLRRQVQEKAQGRARYYFLEEFVTPGVLARAFKLYLRLAGRGLGLRAVRQAFHFPGSALNFWPVLARDWHNSFFGPEAMECCLHLLTFRELAARLPQQEWGLYLWENQPWERSLIFAWQGSDHGKLVGFQHATLRFLDLRFYEDPRSYRLASHPPPLPRVVALNGSAALKLMAEAGFPRERLALVEAVRYFHLQQSLGSRGAAPGAARGDRRNLLVVTGYLPQETRSQLWLLAQAAGRGALAGYDHVLVKPHPDCPVEEILGEEAPDLEVLTVQEALALLWPQAAAVYAANSTSAAVEAALLGLPVLVQVPEDSLNLSPLLGEPGVAHVATVEDLVQGLAHPFGASVSADYFCLEKGLRRWRSLLENRET